MAVDTRDKRMSMIGLASPLPRVLPNPDGSDAENDAERAMYIFMYYGTAPFAGQPMMRRWGGTRHMTPGQGIGRGW